VSPVALFLVAVAGIFLLGAAGEVAFKRTSIPDVVWLIAAGVVLGPVTGTVTREQLYAIAPYFAALTLVVVLFESGSHLRLAEVSAAAPRSGALALLTFVSAALVVAALSMGAKLAGLLPETWTFRHGLLLGAILGGSSSLIIMPAMTQARVQPKVANLVGLESAFTDAFCVVGASALVDMLAQHGGAPLSPEVAVLRSFGIGLGIGSGAGAVWLLLLRLLRQSEHAYPVTLAALLCLYVLIERAGGSAALGILSFALIVGNAQSISTALRLDQELSLGASVQTVHSQMAFIVKSFFFTFIGAMLGPPWGLMLLGVLLGAALLLARVPAVALATWRSSLSVKEKQLTLVALPRGMAAGVLATLPASAGVPGTEELPSLVFACVVTTIAIFAIGFPLVRRTATTPAQVNQLATEPIAAGTSPNADARAKGDAQAE
jgi:cell volume regulation protein A